MSLGSLGTITEEMQALYLKELDASKARLTSEIKDIEIIAEKLKQVIQQADDYSKKLEAPILAKICDVGYFCDAHVVRTNQMTLELGANYFVECSVHSAKKILSRRIAELKKHCDEGHEAIRMIEEKKSFCDTLKENTDEIVEEYDEEAEKAFYENRKKRKAEQQKTNMTVVHSEDKEHQDAMSRLAELELLEEQNSELPTTSEVVAPKPFEVELEEVEEPDATERLLAKSGVSPKEMQALLDYLEACSDEETSDEEYDDEVEEDDEGDDEQELDSDDYDEEVEHKKKNVPKKKKSIRFAQQLENVKTFLQSDRVEEIKTNESSSSVTEKKSILRSKEPTPVDRSALEPEQKELEAMSTVSFPGEIVEKNPYVCQPSTSKDPSPVITETKVSKFRASRSRV